MAHQAKRTDIEGLRAIAVLLVLLYHAGVPWLEGGYLGVDVFFVLSGYLITLSLAAEAERTGSIGLARFYARRARRLLPAAAIVLAATAAAVRWLLPVTTWRSYGGDIIASATYVVNWRFASRSVDYLAEDVLPSPVQHFWSLSVEEQFYLVWPLLLLGAAVMARRRGWPLRGTLAATLLLGVTVPSLVWSVVSTTTQPAVAFFDTGTRMWELAAGGLVALAPSPTRLRGRAATLLKLVALLVVVGAAVVLDERVAWPGATAAVAVVPTAVLLRLGGRSPDVVERGLSVQPMQRVGGWSYSLYLWHWPPIAILAARWGGLTLAEGLAITALSVVPAVLSHHLVENPVRFSPRLVRSHRAALAAGATLTVVGVVAGVVTTILPAESRGDTLVLAPDPSDQSTTDESAAGTGEDVDGGGRGDAADEVAGDESGTGGDGDAAEPIVPPPPGPAGAAILATPVDQAVIDAQLAATTAITPSPTRATDDLPRVYDDQCHVPVTVLELRVCEYGHEDGEVHVALVGDSKAGQWGDALEETADALGWRVTYLLKSGCPFTSVVPALDDGPNVTCAGWNELAMEHLLASPPDVVITSQVASRAYVEDERDPTTALVEGMLDAYDRLEAAGSEVVVLLDNHSPDGHVYECVSANLDALEACTFPRREGSGGRAAQQLAIERGGHASVDMGDLICPTPSCAPIIGNVLVYRQGSHISATYVDSLAPYFASRVHGLVTSG